MKKIMAAADIHGSLYWAKKVVGEFNASGADVLVLLGDIYNHGPRNPLPRDYDPMKVAELLNFASDRLIVIQGNCDSEVDCMISDFDFFRENVLFAFGRRLFFTHGHVHNKNDMPCLSKGDAVFYGHFHINEICDVDGVTAVNVGSCALPKDGKNSYCVIDGGGITLKTFDNEILAQHKFKIMK